MESSDLARVIVREVELPDKAFVMGSWLQGQRYGNAHFEWVDQALFFKGYGDYIHMVFNLPNTRIEVACLEGDHNTICGYIVYGGPVLHWIFTKRDYRNQGIAKLMCRGKDFRSVSSLTRTGRHLIKKYGLVFDPFNIFNGAANERDRSA